jgi:hypothetical protein
MRAAKKKHGKGNANNPRWETFDIRAGTVCRGISQISFKRASSFRPISITLWIGRIKAPRFKAGRWPHVCRVLIDFLTTP